MWSHISHAIHLDTSKTRFPILLKTRLILEWLQGVLGLFPWPDICHFYFTVSTLCGVPHHQ